MILLMFSGCFLTLFQDTVPVLQHSQTHTHLLSYTAHIWNVSQRNMLCPDRAQTCQINQNGVFLCLHRQLVTMSCRFSPVLPYFFVTRVFSVSWGSKEYLNLTFWVILIELIEFELNRTPYREYLFDQLLTGKSHSVIYF